MNYLCCGALGYLIGCINPSYLLGKRKGMDIREKGSGNAGASNALMIFGKLRGVICALLDIAKAYIAIMIARTLFPTFIHAFSITGVTVILGHIFPFYMNFKGGKGLAALAGMVISFDGWLFLILLACEVVVVLVTNYICFVPITASIAFPIIYVFITNDIWGGLILAIATVIICLRHVENLKRVFSGTELRFSYLWKPDEELKRIQNNANVTDEAVEERFMLK